MSDTAPSLALAACNEEWEALSPAEQGSICRRYGVPDGVQPVSFLVGKLGIGKLRRRLDRLRTSRVADPGPDGRAATNASDITVGGVPASGAEPRRDLTLPDYRQTIAALRRNMLPAGWIQMERDHPDLQRWLATAHAYEVQELFGRVMDGEPLAEVWATFCHDRVCAGGRLVRSDSKGGDQAGGARTATASPAKWAAYLSRSSGQYVWERSG